MQRTRAAPGGGKVALVGLTVNLDERLRGIEAKLEALLRKAEIEVESARAPRHLNNEEDSPARFLDLTSESYTLRSSFAAHGPPSAEMQTPEGMSELATRVQNRAQMWTRRSSTHTCGLGTNHVGHVGTQESGARTPSPPPWSLPSRFVSTKRTWMSQLAEFLDDPFSSRCAAVFSRATQIFTFMAALFGGLAPLAAGEGQALNPTALGAVEASFEIVFSLEVFLRGLASPTAWVFFRSPYTWIDLLSVSPLVLRASLNFMEPESDEWTEIGVFLMCLVPVIRLLKLLRHFETFRLLLNAYVISFEALPMLLYTLALINLTFSAMIFIAEPRSNVQTPYHAIWFSVVTMTTVGYGDISPTTVAGHIVTSALIIISLLFTAVPIGIIGSTFQSVWESRDRVLLIARTRSALRKWGYSVQDIPALFRCIDSRGQGILEIHQFTELLKEMNIGLSEARILRLFQCLDQTSSGTLDYIEFAHAVFPNSNLAEMSCHLGCESVPPRLGSGGTGRGCSSSAAA